MALTISVNARTRIYRVNLLILLLMYTLFCEQHLVLGQQGWRIYMGQCVSRKAGAVVAASGHHNSPSYRIMDKAQKQVSFSPSQHLCDVVAIQDAF